jgi:hypothetical protein
MLTTRRAFLRSATLGALALPIPSVPGDAGSAVMRTVDPHPCAAPLRFGRILYDARRAQALAFADAAASSGVPTRALAGNLGDACYEELQARWRIARTPVAGMTDLRVLFLVLMMSSDAGLSPVMRVHHCGHGAAVMHEVFGPKVCTAAAGAQLSDAGLQWGCEAARLVLSLAAGNRGMYRAADMSAANQRTLDSEALVTWAIA